MADQNLRINLTAFDKTQRAFASVRNGLSKVKSSIGGVRGALVALGAGVALRQFAEQIDELAKTSERLGLTVNQLQSLEFAAGQTGVSSQELAKGLERFSRSIGETANNVGIAKRSFEALGITVFNAEGRIKPTRELLGEVSDQLSKIEDPAERVRIAFDLFGRSGTKLINTLKGGNTELKNLQDNFNAITIQLTEEQAQAVEEANDGFDRLKKTFSSLGGQITAFLLPKLQAIAEFLTVNFLRGVVAAIKGARALANSYIAIANAINSPLIALGLFDKIQKATFGEDSIKALEAVIDGYKKLGITLGKVGKAGGDAGNETGTALTEAQLRGQKAASAIADSFGDTFKNISAGTQSASDAFEDMAKKIIARLYDILVVEQLVESIGGSLKKMKIFGGKGKEPRAGAKGGSIAAGEPMVVGEFGKELFVPRQAGNIVPNGKLGGGNDGVTVVQNINISTGVQQTVRSEIAQLMPQIANSAKAAVLDAKQRGGTFSKAF